MASNLLTSSPSIPTIADLLDRLGGVPASRVRYFPLPGSATEQDVIDIEARENRLFELVDGTLVEKGMGYRESMLAVAIASALFGFVRPRKLGLVATADGMMRILPDQVRIPDVSFTSRERLPDGRVPTASIPSISPDLAVEVLSENNTVREMERKRSEYFQSGTRLVWIVDPMQRTVSVYTSPDQYTAYAADQSIDGGDVLPGFTLDLGSLFALLDE
ncbi:Uma2 family endonuclease [Humisphaera borealis]|uniref:Uma2 family endonuclease n=1 Tax=Humisphaera borealis TaxID=2807512 RepID=UPI0019D17CDB|nr:Uma2 family endonuclease [Humisphaera borealis]